MNFDQVDRVRGHTFLGCALGPGSVVVDLGANQGCFSAELIKRFGCKVYAVEPVEEMFRQIPKDPSLTAYRAAMGGADGTANIFLYGGLGSSIMGSFAPQLGDRRETVEQLSLSGLFERAGIERVDLMKVDIEGAEVQMFASASDEQLRSVAQLTVEFHDFVYPELGESVEAVKRRLCALGLAMIKFSVNNADILFVNRDRLALTTRQEAYLRWVVRYREGVLRKVRRQLRGAGRLGSDE